MNRFIGLSPSEGLMSSDDSGDDDYNYLSALDNLNWNCHPVVDVVESEESVEESPPKGLSKGLVRPAVAINSKSNRNDGLLKDMMASGKDKSKDVFADQMKRVYEESDEDVNDNEIQLDIKVPQKRQRQKVNTIKESEYSLTEVLNQKKMNRQKGLNSFNNNKSSVDRLKNDRLFGKAFSPTVYTPEVPVMRPQPKANALERRSLTLGDESDPDSQYSPNAILAIILDWNPKWMDEFTATEVPPPLSPFCEGIGVQTCYESLDEYQSAYIPLILFETWAQIYEGNQKSNSSQGFTAFLSPDYSIVDKVFISINFQTVVPKSRLNSMNMPLEGYLAVIELTFDGPIPQKIMVFGYINDCSSERITSTTSFLPGQPMPSTDSVMFRYNASIGKRAVRLGPNFSITVRSIYYLKPTIRQIELIAGLNNSPLFKDILKPRSFTCQVVVPTNTSLNTPNFNESQNRAIVGSTEAMSRPYVVPKLLCIQGPPGTGKTHTLIGIVKHIFMNWEGERITPRILICAPSNGAVDEIARRLYGERRFLQKHKCNRALRCVRVGLPSYIHPDIRKISLDALIEDNAKKEESKSLSQKKDRMKELEEKASKLEQECTDYRAANRKPDQIRAENELNSVMNELNALTKTGTKPKPTETNRNRLRMEIMDKADIVLTTLNSSHQQSIENLFRNYNQRTFDGVIVDEASQCSEPELLMPLAYKMTKMILIGDPMQLSATVISKKASSLKFGRSLFERFFHYFRECNQNDVTNHTNPILMLTEQYRMHPQICDFPSKHFYEGRLTSCSKMAENREFALKPYLVFDVTNTRENRSDPTNKYNELEANFVVRILTIINKILGKATESGHRVRIGVITPYNGQKNILNKKIQDLDLGFNVEVNTVDGFQGQERDVIILSCVRAFDSQNQKNSFSIGFLDSIQRMNVSLTRAKYSMIVCISGHSLQNNHNWKALIDNAITRPNCRFKVSSGVDENRLTKMLTKPKIEEIICD